MKLLQWKFTLLFFWCRHLIANGVRYRLFCDLQDKVMWQSTSNTCYLCKRLHASPLPVWVIILQRHKNRTIQMKGIKTRWNRVGQCWNPGQLGIWMDCGQKSRTYYRTSKRLLFTVLDHSCRYWRLFWFKWFRPRLFFSYLDVHYPGL